jgi:hypothetical protein
MFTSSFRVTTESEAGSRFDAERTSLSWASFFSKLSANVLNFFSNNKFFKLLFCCTSLIALINLL